MLDTANPAAPPHSKGMDAYSDISEPNSEPAPENMKKLNIYYTKSRCNARLHAGSSSTPAIYYGQTSFSLHSPQLMLRKGDSKTSPMIGFAKCKTTSRHMMIGTGDFQKDPEESLKYEELRREKNTLHRSDYFFGTALGSREGRRAEYQWVKDKNKHYKTAYECRDESGRVIARLFSGGMFNWRKGGVVELAEGLDAEFEQLLLMSTLAIWTMEAFNYQSLSNAAGDEKKG